MPGRNGIGMQPNHARRESTAEVSASFSVAGRVTSCARWPAEPSRAIDRRGLRPADRTPGGAPLLVLTHASDVPEPVMVRHRTDVAE